MLALSLLFSLVAPVAPQGSDDLEIVRRAQAHRTTTVARVAQAVCSVMPVNLAGGGSGVIIDPGGFVLTNFHVVQRRQKPRKPAGEQKPEDDIPAMPGSPRDIPKPRPVNPGDLPFKLLPPRVNQLPEDYDPDDPAWGVMKCGLPDGELYLADVLGIDPGSDLAILRLRPHPEGKPYPFARLGDSDDLLVGETVFAMGNPFLLATDFTPTVTWGVVSGTHRYQPGGGNRFLVYPDCIQVDAPVNPGNSGGPLFNELGQVVGINGRISLRDRGRVNTGVGFAIASNQISHFLGDMMAGRHAEHGTLDMNAWFMNAPDQNRRGVFVQATFADSVVAALGVKLGDEILRFNGQEVRSANQLATLVGVLPAASWVRLTLRPYDAHGEKFGPEREIMFRLRRLDTGSSRNEDRLASDEHRRLAREALTRDFDVGAQTEGVSVILRGSKKQRLVIQRLHDKLRWDDGETVLVRTSETEGFAVHNGEVAELTLEERALLDRIYTTHPLLWTGDDRRRRVAATLLRGGVLVFGESAYRLGLGGDGQRETYFYADGCPAGFRFRDPVKKTLVEYRFDRDHRRARIVSGEDELELDDGWTIEVGGPAPTSAFQRPTR